MGKDYLNLSVRDFMDIISGAARHSQYSIKVQSLFESGHVDEREFIGTLSELQNEWINVQDDDFRKQLKQSISQLEQQDRHKYQSFSKLEILEYIKNKTSDLDCVLMVAFYREVLEYLQHRPFIPNDQKDALIAYYDSGRKIPDGSYYDESHIAVGLDNLHFILDYIKTNLNAFTKPQQNIEPICCGLSAQQLRSIYSALTEYNFVSDDADSELSFIWLLGSGEEPITFKPTKWTGQKNQCAYFVDIFNCKILECEDKGKRILWKPFECLFDVKNLRGARNDYVKTGILPDKNDIIKNIIVQVIK